MGRWQGRTALFWSAWVLLLARQAHCLRQVIAAGGGHSCAIVQLDLPVRCWGLNNYGQLGYEDTAPRGGNPGDMGSNLESVDLGSGGSSVDAIALGTFHSCALFVGGKVKCWGYNLHGQLGLGDMEHRGDQTGEMGDALPFVNLTSSDDIPAIAITAGGYHTCVIMENASGKGVKCWGDNAFGQLGQGDTDNRGDDPEEMGDSLPVVDLGDGFQPIAIAAGTHFTCALDSSGKLKCWGDNEFGQLGQGDNLPRGSGPNQMNNLPPIFLGSGQKVAGISAGGSHVCALLFTGAVKCWGENTYGQLGYEDNAHRGRAHPQMGDDLLPVDLGEYHTAVAVAAGLRFTCALLDDGSVKCWGFNSEGQLGQGHPDWRGLRPDEMGDNLPVTDLGTSRTAVVMAVGDFHSMALLDNGSLKSWGLGADGRLGVGDDANRGDGPDQMGDELPEVDLGVDVVPVCDLGYYGAAGAEGEISCGLCRQGSWSLAGAEDPNYDCIPCHAGYAPEAGLTRCTACLPGTWSNAMGALTQTAANCQQCPPGRYAEFPASPDCMSCPAGTASEVLAAASKDECESCPAGSYADQAGLSSCRTCSNDTYSDVGWSTCLSCPRGTYLVGGEECEDCPAGLTSDPSSISSDDCYAPDHDLARGSSLRVLAGGLSHSCAVLEFGFVKCWGNNGFGKLGNFDPASRGNAPDQMGVYLPFVDLGAERAAVAVAVGADHSCALLEDGAVKCWGGNQFGQLGQNDTEARGDKPGEMGDNLPVVELGSNRFAIAIAAGRKHNCALLDNNDVKCWGNNEFGQLGLGAKGDRGDEVGEMGDNLKAVDLGTTFKAVAIAAGDDNSCALSTTGEVKCWGANTQGQLGQGNNNGKGLGENEMGSMLPPIDLGPGYIAVTIAAGAQHNCALLDNGSVKCWGANDAGQLGYEDRQHRGGAPQDMGLGLHPVDLGNGHTLTAVAIAAGERFTCALLHDGALKCWGDNQSGQLGQGDSLRRGDQPPEMGDNLPPIDLGTGRTVKAVAAGRFHVMALLDDDTLKCWGENQAGQLGLGDVDDRGDNPDEMGGNLSAVDLGDSLFPVCEPGSFGQRSCSDCPAGKWGLAGAATSDECVFCRAGYSEFSGATKCVSCIPGSSSSIQNATSEEMADCQACVAGSYAEYQGSPLCTDCGPGKYCDHQAGTSCQKCGAGKYSSAIGLTDESQCEKCPAGTSSNQEGAISAATCQNCGPGRFSPEAAASTCQLCPIGRYANDVQNAGCDLCDGGTVATTAGSPSCHECEGGTYSVYTECVQCPAGRSSLPGSKNEGNCESLTTSFSVGTALMAATGLILIVYIIAGRAAKVAANERQSALLPIIRACSNISAHILATMKRRREPGVVWQFLVVVLLTVALFVITLLTFLTNTFLLSRSFLATPAWVTALEDQIVALVEAVPLLSFLFIVPPIVRLIESIDFGDLLDGVDVSCSGAQAPLVLFMNALIMIGTVVMIDSQLHTVLALALGPATRLTRDKLISAPDTEMIVRVKNIARFLLLLVVSSFFHSFSRYTMQVFATLINYADFYPYHHWTTACNEGGKTDQWLATVATVLFYAAALPVLLLIIPVMMPGLPEPLAERAQARSSLANASRQSVDRSRSRSIFQRMLDCINPFRWVLFGVDWLLTSLYGHAAMPPPDKRELKRLDLAQSSATKERKVIGFTAFLKSCFCWCCRKETVSPLQIISTCAWKVKLSLYLAVGVWTDEIVRNLQVDEIAQQHFGWTPDHTRSYEDVMAAAGPMRSMVWMLVPITIVLTKLSEATNNPPLFVRSGFVKMTSPVLFGSWKEAEEVMLEGRALLNQYSVDDTLDSTQPGCASGFEHNLLVMLVWIFGARLPQYVVNVLVLLLAACTAVKPLVEVLVLAVCILFPWAFLYALAMVLDVTTMLSLRKLATSSDKPGHAHGGALEFVPVARAVPADGDAGEDADISAFYPNEKHVIAADVL